MIKEIINSLTTNEIAFIGTLLTAIIAIATAIAAFLARKSANETKKAVLAQIIMQIREQFNTVKIPDDIKERQLLGFKEWNKFASELDIVEILNRSDYVIFYNWIIDYYHIFHKLMILYNSKIIDRRLIKKIVTQGELNIFYQIIEPLEKKINLIHEHSAFETFRGFRI